MNRLPKRLDEIEDEDLIRLVEHMKAAGLSLPRIGALMAGGLEGLFDRMTDEEDAAVTERLGAWRVAGGEGPRLDDLTDDQLRRIANGERLP
jgi:hypothetical protein